MSATVLHANGQLNFIGWSPSIDSEGHREYSLTVLCVCTSAMDGPQTIANATGMPAIGAPWIYGNDSDSNALRHPDLSAIQRVTDEANFHWEITLKYSTKPLKRCQDTTVENPLAEPPKISGSFVKDKRPATEDKDANLIINSSLEPVQGLEGPNDRPTVIIEQNVPDLQLPILTEMITGKHPKCLNDAPIWGLDTRVVRLANAPWERKLYGSCSYYFTRRLEFELMFPSWDWTDVVDAGFKVFNSEVVDNAANRAIPANFVVYKDGKDENTPVKIPLDGTGDILADKTQPIMINLTTGIPYTFVNGGDIRVLDEYNFNVLGLPTSLLG